MPRVCVWSLVAVLALVAIAAAAGAEEGFASPYARWKNGPPRGPDYFPTAVWLQPAKYAAQFKEAGVNLVIGIWGGPGEQDLADFRAADMPVICEQSEAALKHKDDPIIVGWLQQDEPDNAQSARGYWKTAEAIKAAWPESDRTLEQWGTYGPPVPPKDVIARYNRMVANDPTRPVYLNLGQGVAYHDYPGRGYRRYDVDDYMEYVKGGDIVSFDLYAYSFRDPKVSEKIWLIPFGVDNLQGWSRGQHVVWNFVEATQVYAGGKKPTPAITRAEVWMSIIHGSRGIVYYAHGQGPGGSDQENALVTDKEMMDALKQINAQVQSLARVLNSPTLTDAVQVQSSDDGVPVDVMAKKSDGATYLFSACMRPAKARATFALKGLPARAQVEVVDEARALEARDGAFADDLDPYQVHIYKVTAQ